MKKNKHPFIQIKNNVRGENPIIAGTGIRVIDVVIEYQYKGYTVDQIIDYHPHLKLKQIMRKLPDPDLFWLKVVRIQWGRQNRM